MVNNFVSISGCAGAGKTTLTNYLRQRFVADYHECRDFSFADPLKGALCLWFDWDRHRLDTDRGYKEGATKDDGSPDLYCQALGKSRREIMQVFGTECMRDGMTQDFWIIMADIGLRLNKILPADLHVIGDARYLNELSWVRKLNGYEILIHRVECPRGEDPTKVSLSVSLTRSTGHASEQEFLRWNDYDETIVNLIDHNNTEIGNMNALTAHVDKVTIPAIRKRFDLSGKSKRNPRFYR